MLLRIILGILVICADLVALVMTGLYQASGYHGPWILLYLIEIGIFCFLVYKVYKWVKVEDSKND